MSSFFVLSLGFCTFLFVVASLSSAPRPCWVKDNNQDHGLVIWKTCSFSMDFSKAQKEFISPVSKKPSLVLVGGRGADMFLNWPRNSPMM